MGWPPLGGRIRPVAGPGHRWPLLRDRAGHGPRPGQRGLPHAERVASGRPRRQPARPAVDLWRCLHDRLGLAGELRRRPLRRRAERRGCQRELPGRSFRLPRPAQLRWRRDRRRDQCRAARPAIRRPVGQGKYRRVRWRLIADHGLRRISRRRLDHPPGLRAGGEGRDRPCDRSESRRRLHADRRGRWHHRRPAAGRTRRRDGQGAARGTSRPAARGAGVGHAQLHGGVRGDGLPPRHRRRPGACDPVDRVRPRTTRPTSIC